MNLPVASHPWCILASIFCHSSHGDALAAVRVGQQVLQGFHLAPPAFLCCLHDTHLQLSHIPVYCSPINGVPVHLAVEGRTSIFCSHLLSLLSQFLKLSRDERPCGSLPPFGVGIFIIILMTLSISLQDGFRFFHNPMPATPTVLLTGRLPLRGGVSGLPRSSCVTRQVRSALFAGNVGFIFRLPMTRKSIALVPTPLPFGPSLLAALSACSA